MSESSKYIEHVAKDARYFPTLVGVFVLGLLLLFFKELSDPIKLYLIPSLLIYVLGTSFLGYWQSMLSWREGLKHRAEKEALRQKDEKTVEVYIGTRPATFRNIILLHVLWLLTFIVYNFYRHSL